MRRLIKPDMEIAIRILFDTIDQKTGYMKLLPASYYLSRHQDSFTYFCNVAARYAIPSLETIEYLNELIGDDRESVLEIGSGNGDFAYHLKIRGTDSGVQMRPEIAALYSACDQHATEPPPAIERLEATEAVRKYQPKTVLGAWVTQIFDPSRPDPNQSFLGGVDEEEIFSLGIKKYILIGNVNNHDRKRIFKYAHKEYSFPWLVSRSAKQHDNRVWIWDL